MHFDLDLVTLSQLILHEQVHQPELVVIDHVILLELLTDDANERVILYNLFMIPEVGTGGKRVEPPFVMLLLEAE